MASNMEEASASRVRRKLPRWVREFLIAGVVVIVVVASLAAARTLLVGHPYDDYYFSHNYKLELFPASSENYTILIPVPVAGDHESPPLDFLTEVHVDGDGVRLSFEYTEEGVALNITGSGFANISWRGTWDEGRGSLYSELSMFSPSNGTSNAYVFVKSYRAAVGANLDY